MLDLVNAMNLTVVEWSVSLLCGFLIGTAKAGLAGTGLMIVPIMAYVFGGKVSTGIVLPMLIVADIFAVKHYNRHAEWKYIIRVMPWALAGILVAMTVGNYVSDSIFKKIMAVTVLGGLVVMIWRDMKEDIKIPKNWLFPAVLGSAGGFATMIGNAAGPVLYIYLLAMRIPKYCFIGTAAWFFLLVNLFKVPLHIFIWKTITWETLSFNVFMIPAIIVGVFVGIQIVKFIPEKPYRILVIATTGISALFLIQ